MAVAPSPNSKASVSAPTKEKKRKMLGSSVEEENEIKVDNSSSKPKKRNSNPGVRVIGGRVYDSENGTTCHQVSLILILYQHHYVAVYVLDLGFRF